MNNLITQAVNSSNQMFAAGYVDDAGSASKKLYGLVQCTRDLSKDECYWCLQEFVTRIPAYCYGKFGGRLLGTTCSVRYESYMFYNSTAASNEGNSGTSMLFWHTFWYSIMLITLHEREPESEKFYLLFSFYFLSWIAHFFCILANSLI